MKDNILRGKEAIKFLEEVGPEKKSFMTIGGNFYDITGASASGSRSKVEKARKEHPGDLSTKIRVAYMTDRGGAQETGDDIRDLMLDPYSSGFVLAVKDPETNKVVGMKYFSKTAQTPEHLTPAQAKKVTQNYDASIGNAGNPYNLSTGSTVAPGYEIEGGKVKKMPRGKRLEKDVVATASIIAFIGSIFFFSVNFTGNVIGIVSDSGLSWIGILLFVIGLVGTYFYFHK